MTDRQKSESDVSSEWRTRFATSSSTSAETGSATEFPSIGSRLHESSLCKPCAWFWKKEGCLNGADCRHCHSCTYGELTRRKSENRRRNRRLSGVVSGTVARGRGRGVQVPLPGSTGAAGGKDDVQCSPLSTATEPVMRLEYYEGKDDVQCSPLSTATEPVMRLEYYEGPPASARDGSNGSLSAWFGSTWGPPNRPDEWDEDESPSPKADGFQRSVTLPTMEGYSGQSGASTLSTEGPLPGSSVASDFDSLEPWELPSP